MSIPRKRLRSESISEKDVSSAFAPLLFSRAAELAEQHAGSWPYKHCIIDNLIDDSLLRRVRREIITELHFTPKETDIYKLRQTGDLLNISGLPEAEKAKLSGLQTLRDALYSPQFREFVTKICDCGPLSGTKQDMSINCYVEGSHLLTHDDVIGSRRVSYILYLPDVENLEYKDENGRNVGWDPKWGGALRLYEILAKGIPKSEWSKVIPPAWNQMAFFVVQPGVSFHDVEEVLVNQQRLAISGWFHLPQKGEEGFVEGLQEQLNLESSRAALADAEAAVSSGLGELPEPVLEAVDATDFTEISNELSPAELEAVKKMASDLSLSTISASEVELLEGMQLKLLTDEEMGYLGKFINKEYLNGVRMLHAREAFAESSTLKLVDFLNDDRAREVRSYIENLETEPVPIESADVESLGWTLARPPHKQRYMYMRPGSASSPIQALAELFASREFRKWLRLTTNLADFSHGRALARRFRPGLDYTLATSSSRAGNEAEVGLLEATLSITPSRGWDDGELGGYELYMDGKSEELDGENDPAVYLSGSRPKTQKDESDDDSSSEEEDEDEDEDDAVLLTSQARWNVFTLVYRDPGVLKFVKYVSQNAPGSRWDVTGEWMPKQTED